MIVDVTMLYDRLLVKVIEGDAATSSGLIVPQIARDNTPFLRGEVIAAGHGRIAMDGSTIPLTVKPGDVVVFIRSANSGEQLVYPSPSGDDLLIIRETHVCLIMRDLPRPTGLLDLDGKQIIEATS